jgi:metal-responsive CopG/Arc/MetJ family transcriptional regulator
LLQILFLVYLFRHLFDGMKTSVAHAILRGSLAKEFDQVSHRQDHGFRAEYVRQALREKIDRDRNQNTHNPNKK